MQTLYIKTYSNNSSNLLNKIKRKFNIFEITNKDNIIICSIPYFEKIKEKQLRKISKKICKKFFKDFQKKDYKKSVVKIPKIDNDYFINKIVFSRELQNEHILNEEIGKYNVEILNGRWLFKYLIIKILEYISSKQNTLLEEKNVAILINDDNEINLNLIILIAQKVKRLSIITNNISKFKYIEERLYNEYGIAIEISNNKRKSLLKTDIIINIDFEEELLNKYKINNKAILVNINKKNGIYSKIFSGININYYNIKYKDIEIFKQNDMYKYFDSAILYESYIYRKDNVYNILDQINKDKVEITDLIGNKGKINYKEFTINSLDKIEKLS